MKVVLATGIYPPAIGGPATYVATLAKELAAKGKSVTVVTYGARHDADGPEVVRVPLGLPVLRWFRYARALRRHARDADIVYCFSSVSCGVPLFLAQLRKPKKLLRLGGDFLWERYTDKGGELSLKDWYQHGPWARGLMNGLLRSFDYLVYSTQFQEQIHERSYTRLPIHGVIENALPAGTPGLHALREPMKLLSMGRFVKFKNLPALLRAMPELPGATLTLAGEGPEEAALKALAASLPEEAASRITFLPVLHGEEKRAAFREHDLLVIPSVTDISPNAALEARAAGLPVLLTEQTGLSTALTDGCLLRELRTAGQIVNAVRDAIMIYPQLAARAASPLPQRGWSDVCDEHIALFRGLL